MADPESLMVQVRNVTKRFDGVAAVDNVSLGVRRGEFFSILGPSGCGKTTLLRMIAGFEQPDEGEILLDGTGMHGVPPHRRNANMVFQSYALFEHLNVWDNVAYGLRRRGVAKSEVRRRVGEMLEMVELGQRTQARPGQLSGGQQQRVALARALVNRPGVLLLDEPLGALDLKLRRQMQIELKHIQRDLDITFVFVTHDQEEALTMSDRLAVMDGGIVRQSGTPAEVYEHPAESFVARFLGTSNLLPGVATPDGVQLDGGPHVPVELPPGVAVGDTIQLALRPEKLELVETAERGALKLTGFLEESVYLGSVTNLHVRVRDVRLVVVVRNSGDQTHATLTPGPVTLAFHPRHARIFAAQPASNPVAGDQIGAPLSA